MSEVSLQDIKGSAEIGEYLKKSDELLEAIGYTEHGTRHADLVATISHNILSHLNFSARDRELAAIAGYLHDIGNLVNRDRHPQVGAVIVFSLLSRLDMPANEIGIVMSAIGNHEEGEGIPVNPISAAVILADKADVHRTRVRNPKMVSFDIHDRVNYAVTHSFLKVDSKNAVISLELKLDTEISQVMEYFEIFLSRMVICRRAAKILNCVFQLFANGVRLL